MSHFPSSSSPGSETSYYPVEVEDLATGDAPSWSRIEAGNALGLLDGGTCYWGDLPAKADDASAVADRVEIYSGLLPTMTASVSSSSSSSTGGGGGGGGGGSYLPSPSVADYPLPPINSNVRLLEEQEQPAYEPHPAWYLPPPQSSIRTATPAGQGYHPPTATEADEAYAYPPPTFGLRLPPIPAAFDRRRRLGQNLIDLPYEAADHSAAWPSPESNAHAARNAPDNLSAVGYYDPSTGRFAVAPATQSGSYDAFDPAVPQGWSPTDCTRDDPQVWAAPPVVQRETYGEIIQPMVDLSRGLGICLASDWETLTSPSSPDPYPPPSDGRERYGTAASESTSNGPGSADEGESEISHSSSPAKFGNGNIGGTYYTYPSDSSFGRPHPASYAPPDHFSAFASPVPSASTPPRLPPAGRPSTSAYWTETVGELINRRSTGKSAPLDKRSHACENCRKSKHKCDGKPPVGGIGPAYADCQLCAKRGTACVFAPLNKRGMSKQNPLRVYWEMQQRKVHRQQGTPVPQGYHQPTVSATAAAAVAAGPLQAVSASLSPTILAAMSPSMGDAAEGATASIPPPNTTAVNAKSGRTASLRSAAPRKVATAARESTAPYVNARRESMP